MSHMKHIAIVTPCFNEIENIELFAKNVADIFANLTGYSYTHLFIDNRSTDGSQIILRRLSDRHKNIACVFNARNFGYTRSSFYGLLLPEADATILISCDFQEPPELIPELLKSWEQGAQVVGGIKIKSQENHFKRLLRTFYYQTINKLSEVELVDHFFDFGLYDREAILELRKVADIKPYLRGLVCELGFEITKVPFEQQKRKAGKTKFSLPDLIDTAMTGLVNQSQVPLRFLTYIGVIIFMLSTIVAFYYFTLKLLYWDSFSFGIAPMILGVFFFGSVNLIGLGILAEYVGVIYSQQLKRELVRVSSQTNPSALNFPKKQNTEIN